LNNLIWVYAYLFLIQKINTNEIKKLGDGGQLGAIVLDPGQSLMIINFVYPLKTLSIVLLYFVIRTSLIKLAFNSIEQPGLSGKISFYNFPIFQAASN
jgi:hypothetical protein